MNKRIISSIIPAMYHMTLGTLNYYVTLLGNTNRFFHDYYLNTIWIRKIKPCSNCLWGIHQSQWDNNPTTKTIKRHLDWLEGSMQSWIKLVNSFQIIAKNIINKYWMGNFYYYIFSQDWVIENPISIFVGGTVNWLFTNIYDHH